ncbi:MAG: hypothetical protein ACRDRG_00990 [Pseudonocardiaceae bacterium]
MTQAHDALTALAAGRAGSSGGSAAPTLALFRKDPPFEPVPTTPQTLLQSAPPQQTPTQSPPPQQTPTQSPPPQGMSTTVAPAEVDTAVDQPPTGDDRDGSLGHRRRRLLAGIMAVPPFTYHASRHVSNAP